ncbi:MAG: hypothetical protein U1F67_06265 [Rubrivivax sp.]
MAFLRRETPPQSIVLSLKPADMFYAGRTMMTTSIAALAAFYGALAPADAAAELRDLGVTHVHLPDYWLPPVYNAALGAAGRPRTHGPELRGQRLPDLPPAGLRRAWRCDGRCLRTDA